MELRLLWRYSNVNSGTFHIWCYGCYHWPDHQEVQKMIASHLPQLGTLFDFKGISITPYSNATVSLTRDIGNAEYINIIVDPDDRIAESNINNFATVRVIPKYKAHL